MDSSIRRLIETVPVRGSSFLRRRAHDLPWRRRGLLYSSVDLMDLWHFANCSGLPTHLSVRVVAAIKQDSVRSRFAVCRYARCFSVSRSSRTPRRSIFSPAIPRHSAVQHGNSGVFSSRHAAANRSAWTSALLSVLTAVHFNGRKKQSARRPAGKSVRPLASLTHSGGVRAKLSRARNQFRRDYSMVRRSIQGVQRRAS